MKKSLVIILVILLIVFSAFFVRFFLDSKAKKALDKAAAEQSISSYKTLIIKPIMKPVELVLPSYLQAINATPIWARTNGYLINFLVDIGDRVKGGQLLAEIDTPDVDAELARAEGELASMIAKEEIAQITADRWTGLYEYNPEAISKEENDIKVADLLSATANVVASTANVEYWKTLQQFKYIYAPFDGIITKRNVIDIGILITAGSANNPIQLFEIDRTDVLRAFVDVPQSHFYFIHDGAPAVATVWELPGKPFPGIIDRNAGALDPKARILLTQVNIDNRSGLLMPGLYAEVKFTFPATKKTFNIPVGALVIRNGPPFVALVKNDKVHLAQVKIGMNDGALIQIIEGLQANDVMIVNPTDRTIEGMTIKAVPLAPEEEKLLMGS